MVTPKYYRQVFSNAKDVQVVKGTVSDYFVVLSSDSTVKLIEPENGNTHKTFTDVGNEKIVEISAVDGVIYIRNILGNVYRYAVFIDQLDFHKSNIIKMNGAVMVSFDKSHAYSTTLQRVVPIIDGNYINVYEDDIKQKIDGSWDGIDYTPIGKVLKFIGKDYYLTTNNSLFNKDGTRISTDVINAGRVSFSRGHIPIIKGYQIPCSGSYVDWFNAHKVEISTKVIKSGTVQGLTIDYGLKEYGVSPDIDHPSVTKTLLWYVTSNGIKILDDAVTKILKVDNNENVTVGGSVFNIWDYWASNGCSNDVFVNENAKSLSYAINDVMGDKSVFISMDGSEYTPI